MLLNHVGKIMKKTGDAVMDVANSSLVKGASRLGTGALKLGVEGAAGVTNKAINVAKEVAPKLKNIDRKKISDNIGKVTNKTMVGLDGDYKTFGKIFNDSKPGKAVNNLVGKNVIDDNSTLRLRGSRKSSGRPKTTYVASGQTFGLADAIGDRAKTYADTVAHVIQGDSWITGKQALLKKNEDSIIGIKATGVGTALFVGSSLVAGAPEAVKQANRNRQGTNFDSSPTSVAPSTPAYANNGGATGDLVFALNNLRHGGMM